MFKKTAAAILVFAIALLSCSNVFAKSYPDVEKGDFAYDAVDYLSDIGVVAGYEDGLFKPELKITRGEAAALIGRALGYTEDYEVKKMPFEDVKSGYWAERFISYCWEIGLVNGMTENLYCPAEKVTYAQIVKMLVCASDMGDKALKIKGDKWYDGYIEVADNAGILENVVILPDEPAPRGDVAILVYNCFKNGLIETETPEEKPEEEPEDNENEENEDTEDTQTPTPKPQPAMADKKDVVFETEIDGDYEFSSVVDYTPEIDPSDIDVSEFETISENEKMLIVIDPGHNFEGTDSGAHNQEYDIKEQHITWPVAEMLRIKLEAMGFEVVMTRDKYNENIKGDTLKEALLNRAGIANKLEADLFISIHCNAGGGKGVETYCYKKGTEAEKLANAVQDCLAEETGLYDRGVKTASFVVIKETLMPAILVETAFIDTESDVQFLISREGQDKISTAIAKGVLEYARNR